MMNRISTPLSLTRTLLKRERGKKLSGKKEGDQVLGRILKQQSSHASLHIPTTDVNHVSDRLHSAM